jgi:simple sugar transport system ATP-binding protein
MSSAPLLRAVKIKKSFGPVTVLKGVDLTVERGEVLALVGDNGAGKSTFIKILSGFHQADEGELFWEGERLRLTSPHDARGRGIETVYQDLALINDLSVCENMFLGREPVKRVFGVPFTDHAKMRDDARGYLERVGIDVPSVNGLVRDLSGGQRQSIAVARAMQSKPRLLIMDEPLAALGVRESAHVLNLVQELRRGREVSIILIVHNYAQIFEVCDRINFLFSGEVVLDVDAAHTSEEELVRIVKSWRERPEVIQSLESSRT